MGGTAEDAIVGAKSRLETACWLSPICVRINRRLVARFEVYQIYIFCPLRIGWVSFWQRLCRAHARTNEEAKPSPCGGPKAGPRTTVPYAARLLLFPSGTPFTAARSGPHARRLHRGMRTGGCAEPAAVGVRRRVLGVPIFLKSHSDNPKWHRAK